VPPAILSPSATAFSTTCARTRCASSTSCGRAARSTTPSYPATGGPPVTWDGRRTAATRLWLATKEGPYLADLLASPLHGSDPFDPAGYDGNQVSAPARLDLALSGQDLPDHGRVVESVRNGADSLHRLQAEHPRGQPYAPSSGWEWGSNGRLLNNLVVLGVAQLVTGATHYRGAVVGGATSTPSPDFPYDPRLIGLPPQCCYLDEPTSEVTNDVCIRWNAPLVWVTSYLGARPSTG
jgi:endoglucanase